MTPLSRFAAVVVAPLAATPTFANGPMMGGSGISRQGVSIGGYDNASAGSRFNPHQPRSR
jgi:hypothetical protein